MSKHVRFSELGKGTRVIEVKSGATLADVLASAGTTDTATTALSQNGRRAKPSDSVIDQASVLLMPAARNA